MIREWQDGDIKTSGRQFAEGRRETELALTYRLKLFLGEYFLDVREGTPWFQSVLGKTPQDVAEVVLKDRLLTSDRVLGIERFNFTTDRRQRRLQVAATVIGADSERAEIALDEELF